jgi:hypothetical protein
MTKGCAMTNHTIIAMETPTGQNDSIVEVFKTNVPDEGAAVKLLDILRACFPDSRINFDLADCDKVLRVETPYPTGKNILEMVTAHGYRCEELE